VLTERARAKVNLSLRVRGRRSDGYHDLESVVAFADCADRLTLEAGAEPGLRITGALAAACGEVADNLVLKAARLLAEAVPDLRVGSFALEKVLPVAAGIGGGSADAAAALRLLARLNGLSLEDPRLQEVALRSGADVPVCLLSRGSVMRGIGERIVPLDVPEMACVMVNPRLPVPTAAVFQALGLEKGSRLHKVDEDRQDWPQRAALSDWIAHLAGIANDLEVPAIAIQPVIGEVLEALRRSRGALLARMSGSGATCFAIFGKAGEAEAAARAIRQAQPSWWVHAGSLS